MASAVSGVISVNSRCALLPTVVFIPVSAQYACQLHPQNTYYEAHRSYIAELYSSSSSFSFYAGVLAVFGAVRQQAAVYPSGVSSSPSRQQLQQSRA